MIVLLCKSMNTFTFFVMLRALYEAVANKSVSKKTEFVERIDEAMEELDTFEDISVASKSLLADILTTIQLFLINDVCTRDIMSEIIIVEGIVLHELESSEDCEADDEMFTVHVPMAKMSLTASSHSR